MSHVYKFDLNVTLCGVTIRAESLDEARRIYREDLSAFDLVERASDGASTPTEVEWSVPMKDGEFVFP